MFLSCSLIHTGIFTLTDFFLIIKNQKVTRTGKKKHKINCERLLLIGSIYQPSIVKSDILSVLRAFILILFNL